MTRSLRTILPPDRRAPHAIVVAVLSIALLGGLPSAAALAASAPTMAAQARTAGSSPPSEGGWGLDSQSRFAVGRYGALKVGMGRRAAVATGMVRSVYAGEPCGWQLQFRRPYRRSWLATNPETGRVNAIGSYREGPVTTEGIGVGSALRLVRRKYGDALRGPEVNFYGQHVFWLKKDRRSLSFFFSADPLGPRSPVTSFIASGRKPIKIFEGEGPC